MSKPPRIYLAGPEVFLPDALAVGAEKCRICAAHGLEGVFPLDASLDLAGLRKLAQATKISLANEGLMRSCDAIIANLTPFRGVSMDSGTAFEVGFMRALGRPVLGYSNTDKPYKYRADGYRAGPRLPDDCDRPGYEVEDFGMTENLMITIAIAESGFGVAHFVPPAERQMAALEAFEICVEMAAKAMVKGG
jgi:nucleoside 2-deoxyribosyltransferase